MEFAEKLIALRKSRELTQEQLAAISFYRAMVFLYLISCYSPISFWIRQTENWTAS